VRLIYKLRSEQLDEIETASIHQALSEAHTYSIQAELVSQLARPRLPELGSSASIDPMEALQTYLDNREDLKDISRYMVEAAQRLLAAEEEAWSNSLDAEDDIDKSSKKQFQTSNKSSQLRLL
jgi:exonuclease SbcD